MRELPREEWPENLVAKGLIGFWQSKDFTCKAFKRPGYIRFEVNKNEIVNGRFKDGITWDEIQELKDLCGFGHLDGYEKFPKNQDIINYQNIRHISILDEPLPYEWANQRPKSDPGLIVHKNIT